MLLLGEEGMAAAGGAAAEMRRRLAAVLAGCASLAARDLEWSQQS